MRWPWMTRRTYRRIEADLSARIQRQRSEIGRLQGLTDHLRRENARLATRVADLGEGNARLNAKLRAFGGVQPEVVVGTALDGWSLQLYVPPMGWTTTLDRRRVESSRAPLADTLVAQVRTDLQQLLGKAIDLFAERVREWERRNVR